MKKVISLFVCLIMIAAMAVSSVSAAGQILFRDNNQRMIEGKQVLVLTDSMSTGSLVRQAIESVLYYGGRVSGICAVCGYYCLIVDVSRIKKVLYIIAALFFWGFALVSFLFPFFF